VSGSICEFPELADRVKVEVLTTQVVAAKKLGSF